METSVRKATRLDYNPPKQKHLQALTNYTYQNPKNAADIVDLLEKRLKENSWIIIFKVLITLHTLMRLGDGERTIIYVEQRPSALDTSRLREKSSGVVHIQNIYLYTAYLEQKVIAFRQLRYDYVKNTMGNKVGRLRRLSVKDGLLKDTIILQKQIGALLKCNFILDDVDNNISLFAFRLLVEDLLVLFQVINESIVNILEHFFAMDKPDARTSLEIYKRFARQTEETVSFLNRARRLQHDLQISIPEVKHAPLSLATALEEYLDDASKDNEVQVQPKQIAITAAPQSQPKELIDFFASLENEKVNVFHTSPVQQQQQQQIMHQQLPVFSQPNVQGHNPFRSNTLDIQPQLSVVPLQMNIVPQQSLSSTILPSQQQLSMAVPQQSTSSSILPNNPFRASTMPQMSFSSPTQYNNSMVLGSNTWLQPSNHNPFSTSPTILNSTTNNPFANNNLNNSNNQKQQLQPWGSSMF